MGSVIDGLPIQWIVRPNGVIPVYTYD